jgi:hypothetical protein
VQDVVVAGIFQIVQDKQRLTIKSPIDEFLLSYNSDAVKHELKCIKTVLYGITDEKWPIFHSLCSLVRILGKAPEILSREQYSTFVCALTVLLQMKNFIFDSD